MHAGYQTAVGEGQVGSVHSWGGGGKWTKEEDENENDWIGRFAEFQTLLKSHTSVYQTNDKMRSNNNKYK